jgi:hypothetical protein
MQHERSEFHVNYISKLSLILFSWTSEVDNPSRHNLLACFLLNCRFDVSQTVS